MTVRNAGPARLVGLVVVGLLVVVAVGAWRWLDERSSAPGRGDTPSATPSVPPRSSATTGGSQVPTASPAPSPSVPAAEVVLVGAGDIAACGLESDTATAELIESLGPAVTVFTAGDLAYPDGSPRDFAECYDPTWGRFRDRTLPAPGNHEWVTDALAGYLGYWGDRAVNEDGDPWYSVALTDGTWEAYFLDSSCVPTGGCGPDSPQGEWLAERLAASDAPCTLGVWHHPRFSSGQHGNATAVAPLWEALASAGGDLVVNGHDHDYERFAALDAGGRSDPEAGMREIVVGTGGAALRGFDDVAAGSEVRTSTAFGVLELTLREGGYAWRFVTVPAGRVLDSGEDTCH